MKWKFYPFTLLFTTFFSWMSGSSDGRPCPSEALKRLLDGNERYVQDELLHPNRTQESRDAVKLKQNPFAVIVGCSDSRVSPEILFDQGIGDLFVVRVAGQVVGPIELDSIEYSSINLGSSLIFVLGHENCGAVTAVLNGVTKDIEAIAELMQPAIDASKNMPGDPLVNAIEMNVKMVVRQLEKSPVLARLVEEGKLTIAGGYYHLATGKVELLH